MAHVISTVRLSAALAAVMSLAAPAAAQRAPAVLVAPAQTRAIAESARYTGRVRAVERVDVRARVAGFVEARPFREGARVEAGETLFEIEDEAYAAAVAEADGAIASAEAELRLAEIERDRKATLVERGSLAQSELDIAEAQLGQVDGRLAQLRARLAEARLQLSYATVVAPFAGRTGLAAADVGALVGPDSGALVTVTRLDPIQVEFPIASADWLRYRARVAAGETTGEAAVALDLSDGSRYPEPGDIDFVDPVVDQGTDTVLIRAEFENPDGLLLDGALVTVALTESAPREALTVPRQAVQRDMAGPFVLVVGDGDVVERRVVETGAAADGRIVIRDGLDAGERVIVEGVNKARPGQPVTAAPFGEG